MNEAPTPYQAPFDVRINDPQWVRQPSAKDISAYYPKAALQDKMQGSATLLCQVSADGGLYACRVISEGPEGEGFGRAALAVSGLFELRPARIDGRVISGASVKIPVQFVLPKDSDSVPIAILVGVLCVLAAIGFAALVLVGQRLVLRLVARRGENATV